MVIFELLGHGRQQRIRLQAAVTTGASEVQEQEDRRTAASAPAFTALPPPRKTRGKASRSSNGGTVKGFVRDHLFPADDDERVEIKSLIDAYRDWCSEKGASPIELDGFLDEIEQLCRKLGIRIEVGDDQRVYCHGVRIEAPASVH
jgi:hypothetical protein